MMYFARLLSETYPSPITYRLFVDRRWDSLPGIFFTKPKKCVTLCLHRPECALFANINMGVDVKHCGIVVNVMLKISLGVPGLIGQLVLRRIFILVYVRKNVFVFFIPIISKDWIMLSSVKDRRALATNPNRLVNVVIQYHSFRQQIRYHSSRTILMRIR